MITASDACNFCKMVYNDYVGVAAGKRSRAIKYQRYQAPFHMSLSWLQPCFATFRLLRLTKAGQVQVKGRFAFERHP